MIAWPSTLCPFSGGFAPFVRSLSGGQSLSGFEQVQPQLHDRWTATFGFHIHGKATIFALRSLLTQLRGRSGTILVPTFEHGRAPLSPTIPGVPIGAVTLNPPFWKRWPDLVGTAFEYSSLPTITGNATVLSSHAFSFAATGDAPEVGQAVTLHSLTRTIKNIAGSKISIEPHFAIGPDVPGTVSAIVYANAAINAVSLDVQIVTGSAPLAGNYFSLGNRLHSVNAVVVLGSGIYRLSIWPWLRAAITAGELVNFTSPACEMRLASDGEGADTLRSLVLRKFGDATLSFDEIAIA